MAKLSFTAASECEPFVVRLPNGSKIEGRREFRNYRIHMGARDWEVNLIEMALQNYDIILGWIG